MGFLGRRNLRRRERSDKENAVEISSVAGMGNRVLCSMGGMAIFP
jgi:hypothetical protein